MGMDKPKIAVRMIVFGDEVKNSGYEKVGFTELF